MGTWGLRALHQLTFVNMDTEANLLELINAFNFCVHKAMYWEAVLGSYPKGGAGVDEDEAVAARPMSRDMPTSPCHRVSRLMGSDRVDWQDGIGIEDGLEHELEGVCWSRSVGTGT